MTRRLPRSLPAALPTDIPETVARALQEDIGDGDITASLIPADQIAEGSIICRESAVLCGIAWADEVIRQVDTRIELRWLKPDGARLARGESLAVFSGPARSLLTAERCMLNFLQTLSGTATTAADYAERVAHTGVTLLDTRKTLPGLRTAQKYAVRVGGCHNHRMGLFDAFLIKENHIAACGSITAAVARAREVAPDRPVEVEVENAEQLREALAAGADTIMLDNFSLEQMREAVAIAAHRKPLEASGNITRHNLADVAETGVDYISIGALTKDCRAIDLSMRF